MVAGGSGGGEGMGGRFCGTEDRAGCGAGPDCVVAAADESRMGAAGAL